MIVRLGCWFVLLVPSLCVMMQQTSKELPFAPKRMMPKQDPILIDKYRIATIAEANTEIRDQELVLGVALDGEARAYPLNRISGPKRELLNDTVGGKPIAITWCSLCFSAIVFDRQTQSGLLELGIAGSLWHDNMVMYDTKTQSLWSQIRGEAMSGPLQGIKLTRLASDVMTWNAWKREHPETTVAMFSRTTDEFSRFPTSSRLTPALTLNSEEGSRVWELSELRSQPILNETWKGHPLLIARIEETGASRVYSRAIEDRELTFVVENDSILDEQTRSTWDPRTGEAIDGPLRGRQLRRMPTSVASKPKWQIFYPDP